MIIRLKHWQLNIFTSVALLFILSATETIAGINSESPPNIVLVVIDTLRKDHLGIYGYSEETMPFIAEKAKEGLVFLNYYSNSSETVASHASLFSGNLSDPYDYKIDHSFVNELKKAGYRTYGISANPLISKTLNFNLGFDVFESDPPSENTKNDFISDRLHQLEIESGQKNLLSPYSTIHLSTTADLINPRIFSILEKHLSESASDPYFLFINYLEPHDPYFPHGKSTLLGNYNLRDENDSLEKILCDGHQLTAERRSELIHLYDGEIRFVDTAIRQLYEWMKSRKIQKNTIFLITSDHGEMLGENNLWTHSLGLFLKELEIPMIIFGDTVRIGRMQYLMSHTDTGSLIISYALGSNKKFLKEKKRNNIVLQRHRVLESQSSWRRCLPEMGRVELFRFTGLEASTLYYQLNGKENIGVFDNNDLMLKTNRFNLLVESSKRRILNEIRKAIKNFMGPHLKIDEKIERQLRSLGYIR